MLGKGRGVCVLTASKQQLSREYFEAVGIAEELPIFVAGLDDSEEFNASHMGGTSIETDVERLRSDVVEAVRAEINGESSIGAVVVEGALLAAFSADIQQATGLPVFDYIGYIEMLFRAVVPKRYQGFL